MNAEVLAAAAVLDQDRPGWHRQIDLGRFTLAGFDNCVICQAYGRGQGEFYGTLNRLFGAEDFDNDRHCDRVNAQTFFPKIDKDKVLYEESWRELISARQAADRNLRDTLSTPDVREEVAA